MAEETPVVPPVEEEAGPEPTLVPRVDRDKHDARISALKEEIAALEVTRTAVLGRIEGSKSSQDAGNAKIADLRAKFQAVRDEHAKIKAARQVLLNARDAAKAAQQKVSDFNKSTRRGPNATVESIDSRISALRMQQSTESMSLAAEREILREIEVLRAQRSGLAAATNALAAAEAEAAAAAATGKDVNEKITKLNEVMKEVSVRLNAAYEGLKAVEEGRTSSRGVIPELFKERDAIRATINDKYAEMKKVQDDFYAASRAHGAYVAAHRRWKAITYAREKAAGGGGAEGAADGGAAGEEGAGGEGEEGGAAAPVPWARERVLCDILTTYLTSLLPAEAGSAAEAAEAAAREAATQTRVAAFAKGEKGKGGLKVVGADAEKDEFAGVKGAKSKGKGSKGGKASEEKEAPAASTKLGPLTLDVLSAYGLLSLPVPTTVGELPGAIAAVKAKKEWYSTQPAPSVLKAPAPVAATTSAVALDNATEGEAAAAATGGPTPGVRGSSLRGRGRGGYAGVARGAPTVTA